MYHVLMCLFVMVDYTSRSTRIDLCGSLMYSCFYPSTVKHIFYDCLCSLYIQLCIIDTHWIICQRTLIWLIGVCISGG